MNKENNYVFSIISAIAILFVSVSIIMIFIFNEKEQNIVQNNNLNYPQQQKKTNSVTPPIKQDTAPIVKNDDHIKGNPDAENIIIEYSDFQCPYCARFHSTLEDFVAKYPNDVKWVYRHFPLNTHKYAQKAAEASECAAEQGKFWEYAEKLYNNQRNINNDYFTEIADEFNLDIKQFNICLSSDKYAAKVMADFNEGKNLGVSGTPGSFFNGQRLKGAVSLNELEELLLK